MSPDDSTILVANRDVGTVTVLRVDYADGLPAMTEVAEIPVGAEPWQVAIDGCSKTGYVVSRRDAKLVEIQDLDTNAPIKGGEVDVGSEPTGLALSPNNGRVYVANWVEGTTSVVDTSSMTIETTIDLNQTLADSGFLGASVTARPALAHPRSIAITNDGDQDDTDETVVITEFFGQRNAPEAQPDAANADINWVGLLYEVPLGQTTAELVELEPVATTGFMAGGADTGCFANQLQSVTMKGSTAFVTSVCASPRGPTAAQVMTHPMVHAIDLAADTSHVATLTTAFDAYYDINAPDDADPSRRFPLLANDIAFEPVSGDAFLTANGADAVFRLVFDGTGALTEVGAGATNAFVDLVDGSLADAELGLGPVGIATAHGHAFAFVANDVSRNVTAIDLGQDGPAIAGLAAADPRIVPSANQPVDPVDQAYLRGKDAFNSGLGRWSLNGQAWGACQVCHFEGLSDNVTWYFGRGPRQSTSLDGSFASNDKADQRIFNWTAVFDEIADFEMVARNLDGAKGALVHPDDSQINLGDIVAYPPSGALGLNGSATQVLEDDSAVKTWEDVAIYIQRVRSPRAPKGLAAASVAAGKALFEGTGEGQCQGCHGGAKWTISTRFYTPSGATNEALKTTSWDGAALVANGFPAALLPSSDPANQVMRYAVVAADDQLQCVLRNVGTFGVSPPDVNVLELKANMTAVAQGNADNGKGYNIPSLLGLSVGAPYFHAGNARTLEEALDEMFAQHHRALSPDATFLDDPTEKGALVAYLLSIDESTTPIAPPATPGAAGGWFCAPPQ